MSSDSFPVPDPLHDPGIRIFWTDGKMIPVRLRGYGKAGISMRGIQKEDKFITSKITYPFSDNLNAYQEQRYKEMVKKQYRNIHYTILEEYVGDVDSNITIQVTVIDLKDAYEKANSYVFAHKDKFVNEKGDVDEAEVINYKLEQMEKAKDTVDYSIVINYYKNDRGQWVMTDLSSSSLEKIAGVF